MKLCHAPASPFARKVRVCAEELGIPLTLETVQVAPTQPNRDFADAVNPLRKIPALVTDDGEALYDSTVICLYLDARAGGGKLLPAEGPGRWRMLTAHALANGMTEAAVTIRYESVVRPEPQRWQAWIDDQMDRIWAGLDWFERHPEARAGATPDLAQIALGCLLGYLDFRFADCGWRARCPAVADWYATMRTRPSFQRSEPGG
ncbi:MAG: glutathione S-transferase [Alphaproteobacteria bacterium]